MVDWFGPLSLDPSLSVLPVQSMAKPQAADTSAADNKDALQFVPSDQLEKFLMGKFDEPNIPSGLPSQEQQQQALGHRAIGNATGDVVANLQNTANILKPGAGNPAMGDSSRRYGEMLAQQALGNNAAKRQEALQDFTIKDAAKQRYEKMLEQAAQLKQQRDLKMLELAQAQGLARAKAASDQAKMESEDANRKSEAQRRKEETSLGWANLAESRRQHDLEAKAKEDNKSKLQLNEDKKAEEDIANLRNAKAELDRHIENLKNGVINNDKGAVYGNEAVKFASSLGLPVQPNAALQDMLTSIPLAQATAEKAVTGSSRYTPQRWTQFAVQPGEGTKNSVNKLSGGSRYLDELIKERMTQLHTNAEGVPTSQSAMAKSFPPGAIQNTAAEVQAHTKTGAPPTPGAIRNLKNGGKAQQQPDDSWKRIE